MIFLIVNADDFGHSPGVSEGIMEAHIHGIVTSTTAMMNMPSVISDLEKMRSLCPKLGAGVHLILTEGKPVLEPEKVTSLIDSRGKFLILHEDNTLIDCLNFDQVYEEWTAQIEKFLSTGLEIDHLDSHHHVSYSHQSLFEIMLFLSKKYSIPIRHFPADSLISQEIKKKNPTIMNILNRFHPRWPDSIITTFYDESALLDQLLLIIHNLQKGIHELMCHPGYADEALIKMSIYHQERERELAIITDNKIQQATQSLKIILTNFSCLK